LILLRKVIDTTVASDILVLPDYKSHDMPHSSDSPAQAL